MAAIDLLLNWSPTSERMHQVVLTGLLRHTRLLELLGINGTPTDIKIETQSRLYDFTVTVLDGTVRRQVHIELKVDAVLSDQQIKRQMAAVADGDLILYVLIGMTCFTWSGMKLEALRAKLEQAPHAGAVRIIGLAAMREGISALASQSVDENHRDLAVAYGSLLRKIHNATADFEGRPLQEWKPCGCEWYGLYSEIVRRLEISDAGIAFVNNEKGGFVGCWWNVLPLSLSSGSEAYLQCEERLLCFKVVVKQTPARSAVRNRFSKELLNAAHQLGFPAKKPGRFGSGTWMTVAVMDGDYRCPQGENALNWTHLSQALTAAGSVLELAVRNCSDLKESTVSDEEK